MCGSRQVHFDYYYFIETNETHHSKQPRSPKFKECIAPHFPSRTVSAIRARWSRLVKDLELEVTFECPVKARLPGIVSQGKYKWGKKGNIAWGKLVEIEFPEYDEDYVKTIWRVMTRKKPSED
jgi:hypothetical protein